MGPRQSGQNGIGIGVGRLRCSAASMLSLGGQARYFLGAFPSGRGVTWWTMEPSFLDVVQMWLHSQR